MPRRLVFSVAVLALVLLSAGCGGSESQENPDRDTADDAQVTWDTPGDVQKDQQGTDGTPDTVLTPCASDFECDAKMVAAGAPAPACKKWACDAVAGCVQADVDNGASCDDKNACTENDRCLSGGCVGDGVGCDDQNPCTADTCEPTTGCHHANADGATCNDGDMCTLSDACANGKCTGSANPECVCDQDADCAQFDDGDKCNGSKMCAGATCITDPDSIVDCSGVAAGPCEQVACESASGACVKSAKPNGTPCTDGSACTLNDACAAGQCVGSLLACDDANTCTDDTCAPGSGCVHAANAASCDDHDLCTTADTCSGGVCTGVDNPECQCTVDADCAPYDDGNLCNGTLVCSASGRCEVKPETVITCNPDLGGPCDEVFCAPATGTCDVKPALDGTGCDDGNACTVNDVCAAGICLGDIRSCADSNGCTDDGCEPETGCVFTANSASCDDGNGCTSGDACSGSVCAGAPEPSCQCDETADCASQEDGNLCNGTLACDGHRCRVVPASVIVCPEQAGCTQFECVPETGACAEKTAADGTGCSDGNKCTAIDVCAAGQCEGSGETVCDDGNLCTDESCDPTLGCQHAYNALPCDDGNDCTDNDTCAQGVCAGTSKPECVCQDNADCGQFEDGDRCNGTLVCVEHKCVVDGATMIACPVDAPDGCTFHHCDPETGACDLINIPDGRACSDHDACTTNDACSGGQCLANGALVCNNGNPCTTDACDKDLGCLHGYNTADCDDKDPCTSGDVCKDGVCQPGATNVCPQTCSPAETVACGSMLTWSTTGPKATDALMNYPCAVAAQNGPEYAVRFDAPFAGNVRVFLTGEDSATNLFVLQDSGAGCGPDACLQWDFATAEFHAAAGDGFYLVVDSKDMPSGLGAFTLNVACVPDDEQVCDDGDDDDQDGLTDCDDVTDCPSGSAACPVANCEPNWELACGDSDHWSNHGVGSTDLIPQYACATGAFGANEYTYWFTPAADGTATFTLDADSARLEMFVLSSGGEGTCSPLNCLASDSAVVTFAVTAGQTYYLVVDGPAGAQSWYTLDLTCTP